MSFRRVFGLLLPLVGMACGDGEAREQTAAPDSIVGGRPVDISQVPWQVSLQSSRGHFCGGSILNESYILTAAHCVRGQSASRLTVLAGTSRVRNASDGQVRQVRQISIYPGYRSPERGRDAAVLELASPLVFSPRVASVSMASAAEARDWEQPGTVSEVTGWGALSSGGSSPDRLQRAEVQIFSNADAQSAYTRETITEDQLAAGLPEGGRDACQGDSGGPLVVRRQGAVRLVGIVSWGYGCASARYPGMYGRVSSFSSWIEETSGAPPADPVEPPPPPLGVMINEILADPGSEYDANGDGRASIIEDEFVELVNPTSETIDLSGYAISERRTERFRFPQGTSLAPGRSILVFGGGTPSGFDVEAFTAPSLGLNNGGDLVTLTEPSGRVADRVEFGAEAGFDQSLVRERDGDPASSFVLHGSVASIPASPGVRADGRPFDLAEVPAGTQLIVNELLADPWPEIDANRDGRVHSTQDEFIELVNVGAAPVDLAGITVSDGNSVRFSFTEGTLAAGRTLVVFGGGSIGSGFPSGVSIVVGQTLGLNNGGDTVTVRDASGAILDRIRYGSEGGQDQSLVRAEDAQAGAPFIPHLSAGSLRASPGFRSDGSTF